MWFWKICFGKFGVGKFVVGKNLHPLQILQIIFLVVISVIESEFDNNMTKVMAV